MNMENVDLIIIKSATNKTNQTFYIAPCVDPSTGLMPSHIRRVDSNGDMILSEKDKQELAEGKIFLPIDEPIIVTHGKTFNLNNPLEKAQWDAIKYSRMISKSRFERDANGNLVIDGPVTTLDKYGNAKGTYGIADLYIETPGEISKSKNSHRKLVLEAQNLILKSNHSEQIRLCKLLEKDMSRANPYDVEDFLFTMAEKNPNKIKSLFIGTNAEIRMLLITAIERKVVMKKDNLLTYNDTIILGSSLDKAVEFLQIPKNVTIKDMIQKETYPELEEQSSSETENKSNKK